MVDGRGGVDSGTVGGLVEKRELALLPQCKLSLAGKGERPVDWSRLRREGRPFLDSLSGDQRPVTTALGGKQ
ncbi:MAG: hypothetical protein JRH07_13780 [Deltaproteobacteria bacterium]|nr:hypothetical protein [Deltaproteobacteria bacterium]MBW2122896.1 hypothetical protein [Deltaproteobacteria bacterium]